MTWTCKVNSWHGPAGVAHVAGLAAFAGKVDRHPRYVEVPWYIQKDI
jgi:hypothetical protein